MCCYIGGCERKDHLVISACGSSLKISKGFRLPPPGSVAVPHAGSLVVNPGIFQRTESESLGKERKTSVGYRSKATPVYRGRGSQVLQKLKQNVTYLNRFNVMSAPFC